MLKKASGIEFYESGSGQPIVFLHGVGSTYESFQYQFGKISGRLIAVNIPGYGKSDSLELYNFDTNDITFDTNLHLRLTNLPLRCSRSIKAQTKSKQIHPRP